MWKYGNARPNASPKVSFWRAMAGRMVNVLLKLRIISKLLANEGLFLAH
jgi:hypothetical protein